MRITIISDIHGNATAFEAVLADIEERGAAEAVYCLGDNVGYGPEPEKVLHLLRQHKIASIMGNHELAITKPATLSWFNPTARLSLEKTASFLSADSKGYMAGFPTHMSLGACRLVHGFPPDSALTYLFEVDPDHIRSTLSLLPETIFFIGHTHELLIIESNGKEVRSQALLEGGFRLDPQLKYLINVGSVGQPRDGTNHAKYVIFDDTANELTVRYVAYNAHDTAEKIRAAGLPEQHAWRLL